MSNNTLTSLERKSISALAAVYGLRMFGLFLILPVLAIYAEELDGASPVLMGIALGVYGMTQAIFQIPFGMLSDRYGRKPLIIIGLLIFVVGSLIAAFADSIGGVIFGRALQGTGAIASVVLALTSDLTRENQRTKAMATIGMSIGGAFLLALLVAPILEFFIGVQGLFILTACLALLSILVIWKVVPTPAQTFDLNVRAVPSKMLDLLKHKQLIRLDVGIFILHYILTSIFVVVPIILLDTVGLEIQQHWQVYVPALLCSIVFMVPMVIASTRKKWLMRIFLAAVCILLFAQALFMWRPFGLFGITFCLFTFFWGFNLLEALLPSLISRIAPAAAKGSAMGVYNTFQFLGVFFGGLFGGILYGKFGVNAVFMMSSLLLFVWVWLIQTAPELKLLDSMVVKLNSPANSESAAQSLRAEFEKLAGIEEVIIMQGESLAYLKVDKDNFDNAVLNQYIQTT